MTTIKVSLSYIICIPRAARLFLWCIHTPNIFLPSDTGDFLSDDDYQGITKLYNLYAYRAGHAIQSLWCIHVLHAFIPAHTGDFVLDDDYQGIIKLHDFYAWNWPCCTCASYIHVYTLPPSFFEHR